MNFDDVKELKVGDPIFHHDRQWKGKVETVSEYVIKVHWELDPNTGKLENVIPYSVYNPVWEELSTFEITYEDQDRALSLAQIRRVIEEEFSICLDGVDLCSMPDGCTMLGSCEIRKAQECILQRLDDLAHRRA